MPQETMKTSHSTGEGEKQKQLYPEVRDMLSAITHRIAHLHKPGSSHQEDEDDHGVGIVTLAGTNTGATMRSELDEESSPKINGVSPAVDHPDALNAYVNSNFQAVNNSIMMGSSYNTNDPGVHVDISDVFEHHGHKPDKHGKKGARKDKASFKSDHHSESDEHSNRAP